MLNDAKKIHVVGIGGIGVSAIAKLLVKTGCTVSGSDLQDSEIAQEAARAGVKIAIGHQANQVGDAEALIYSEAVPRDNSERVAAREKGVPEYSGAEALAEITKGKRLIAIAGTNGKSTTTALVGLLLEAAGFDPTVIVGSKVPNFELGNVRVGKSAWFVLEADEYQSKFLQLAPEIAVVTNIEEDHLDYFHDLAHIRATFEAFLNRVEKKGTIILNADDPESVEDIARYRRMKTFGIQNAADYSAKNIAVRAGRQWFEMWKSDVVVGEFSLQIPGRFNIMNTLAALAAAFEVGVSVEVARAVLEKFYGIWRRFERVGEYNGATVISDYGHHPSAIRGTLAAAREFYPGHRIVLVFQPHQHHRTQALFKQFVDSFAGADVLVLADVYHVPGRDENEEVGSENLANSARAIGKPQEVHYIGDLKKTEALVRKLSKPEEIIICMGAGDIDVVARNLVIRNK